MKLYGQTTGKSQQSAQLIRRPPKRVYARAFGESLCLAEVVPAKALPIEVKCCSETLDNAELNARPSQPMRAEDVAESNESAELIQRDVVKMVVAAGAESATCAELIRRETEKLKVAVSSETVTDTRIEYAKSQRFASRQTARTTTAVQLGKMATRNLRIAVNAKSKAQVVLDSAWYPPIHRGTNLYIRQAYSAEQSGSNLDMQYMKTQRLSSRQISKTITDARIDKMAIRNMRVAADARSNVQACMDSAWYPPVRRDTELHIRQAYEAIQTENNLKVV